MDQESALDLLNRDAVPNPRHIDESIGKLGDDEKTALHLAVEKGQENAVKRILEDEKWRGMVNKKDNQGRTPLNLCSEEEHAADNIAEILIDNGADANISDDLGWVPLHNAASRSDDRITELLLGKGKAITNKKTLYRGATPLHMAVDRGHVRITELLLEAGANRDLTTWNGETSLNWALLAAMLAAMGEDGHSQGGRNDDNLDRINPHVDYDDYYNDFHEGAQQNQPEEVNQYDRIISKLLEGKNKSTELLKIASQADDEELVRYSTRKLYPGVEGRWTILRNIWLAMRKDRFGQLEESLRPQVRERGDDEIKTACESWNALDLAAFLGISQILKLLLRSHRWTKTQKEHAKNLLQDTHLPASVWDTPFTHHSGTSGENYRFPDEREGGPNGFRASIVDFYTHDKQFDFVCDSVDVFQLLYSGPNYYGLNDGKVTGPQKRMEDTINRLSQDFVLPDPSMYRRDNLRFRWIHLPANCVEWMKDITKITYLENQKRPGEITDTLQFLQQSWHELPESRLEGRYMSPKCLRKSLSLEKSEKSAKPEGELALYMPYITFGSLDRNEREEKLNEYYGASKAVIHKSRTLDEIFHGPTAETKKRDFDQVVTRWINRNRENETRGSSDILRVDQLWLWVIDDKTVISSGTQRADDDNDPLFEGILNRLVNAQEELNGETMLSSVDSFVKLIASFYINDLDNLSIDIATSSRKDQRASVYEIFAGSIEKNNEDERALRDDFKKQMVENQGTSEDTDAARKTRYFHDSIVQALDILTDIKDIRDELNIMTSIVETQGTVWSQLFGLPNERREFSEFRQETKQMYPWMNTDPDYVLGRINNLLRYAEETQKNIESILDLRMNQLSLYEAEESRRQGQNLMVFTIVTVIFLPLSFLSSLFALNVATYPHSGDNLLYQPGWIFGIIFGVSAGFVILLLFVVRIREATIRWVIDTTEKYSKWAKRQRGNGTQDNTANAERRELLGNGNRTMDGTGNPPTGTPDALVHDDQPTTGGGEQTETATQQQNDNNTANRGRQGRIARWWHRRRNPQNGILPLTGPPTN
ncbi:hypothetical protein GGR53DRAFT_383781 [Hypoxylon sp. FL1150]|nr:hypothetical protein GGR53DRAFT_383781 [Hypoxylon sp. FL1150]